MSHPHTFVGLPDMAECRDLIKRYRGAWIKELPQVVNVSQRADITRDLHLLSQMDGYLLRLDAFEHRGIKLWTNPRDVVLSPFGGIGSEPYVAVEMGRRAVAVELKESYYRQMVANMKALDAQADMFGTTA